MRLRPLVIAVVLWMASLSASTAGETPSASGAARPIFLGVMGEVAHPGAYQAPAACTLTELIKRAGGITPRADKAIRIFRGGLLIEQVFLGSGEAPSLLSNDLIVVGSRSSFGPHITAGDPSAEREAHASVPAVQIAFVNLIDRPVIVKMRGDQATLGRITEILGQSAECAAQVRVFAPLGSVPNNLEAIDRATSPLESGTVLAFPTASVQPDRLPAFPEPIADKPVASRAAPLPGPIDSKPVDPNPVDRKHADALPGESKAAPAVRVLTVTAERVVDPAETGSPTVDRGLRSPEIAPHIASPGVPPAESRHGEPAAVGSVADIQPAMTGGGPAHPVWERERDSRAGRLVVLMVIMSALAGLAMLLTVASIVKRWLESGKLPFRRLTDSPSDGSSLASSPAGIPVPPIAVGVAGRPIRIDAGQPITRLSVDLAALEREPRSTRAC